VSAEQTEVVTGNGFAAGNLDGMGEGYGFRKIRAELDIKEFGANAVVLPPGIEAGAHWHDKQEELYFVFEGTLKWTLGENDEDEVVLGPGGCLRVDAQTQRWVANVGDVDATYVAIGAFGGYVGRDGQSREGDNRVRAGQG
jgi:mannose-6-phosphate isomerase-like protein (cupin superfamily)